MAIAFVIRRAASSSITPARVFRAIAAQTSCHSAIFGPLRNDSFSQQLCRTPFLPSLSFSSVAKKSTSDQNLLRVIDSEIKYAQESDDHNRVEETPDGFPFEIVDKHGEQTVSLTRKYQDEVIKVEVHMPDLVTGNDANEDNDDGDDDDAAKGGQSSIPLIVSVQKGNGQYLEFGVTAYADEISIDSLSVKDSDASQDDIPYEGPDFGSLDENLQKAFHKFLEIRGIKPSTTNFLHEFMINKDSREYLVWLKNLRKFIEN